MTQKRKLAAVLLSLGCLQAGSVWALGLGEMTMESFLNEPLKAQVNLLNTGGLLEDEIKVRLATSDDFDRMGVERAYFLTGIKFEVTVGEDGHGVITLSSDDPVLEPYLDFIVETRWPSGRLLREYTVLVDPPAFDHSSQVISASERVFEEEGLAGPEQQKKKQATEASSGTQVDIKESGLASGQMPQRDFSADTTGAPLSGNRYMIKRDETLWTIAMSGRPEGVSVHQAMLDIQRMNPNAFIDGNINRIKAGYIIYLPTENDISFDDLPAALAAVKQQNEDWRAGRASEPTSGPSLRISADAGDGERDSDGDDNGVSASMALEQLDRAQLENMDMQGQVDALSQQLNTLERIVDIKDDQIAALQAALEDARNVAEAAAGKAEDSTSGVEVAGMALEVAVAELPAVTPEINPIPEEQAKPIPAPIPVPMPAPAVEESGGFFSNIYYVIGAVVLALLAGLMFWRRSSAGKELESVAIQAARGPKARDAFEGVKLKEQVVEVALPASVVDASAETDDVVDQDKANRGYGQRKNDEYASDSDSGDALAEADIYIAYGRYPQAADLLKTAIQSEPENAAYRLKLLELSLEMGEPGEAENQLAAIQAAGDAQSIASADALMSGGGKAGTDSVDDMLGDLGVTDELEADFGSLEVDDGTGLSDMDELDLSDDFASADDEEMVFAAEGNTLSTKLDLARAYMDMGDEDGARQILSEVAADGDAAQQSEAQSLLERLG
jgi:pilus assembly protein FimV